jgi:hypothetical protein
MGLSKVKARSPILPGEDQEMSFRLPPASTGTLIPARFSLICQGPVPRMAETHKKIHCHGVAGLDWGHTRIGLRYCLLHRSLRCRQHHRYAADARPYQQGYLAGARLTAPTSRCLWCLGRLSMGPLGRCPMSPPGSATKPSPRSNSDQPACPDGGRRRGYRRATPLCASLGAG